ncbi:hypothetical protein MSG28_007662 [Choristoneura fumiferana]|uniref:Uncharacterized protein n=1 Tax=Choristoneura fumiferana TaxID=7141 RepID=A0ACC0JY92_CHOFU|nr:hypothetical protein MSG28_007662 [Choristoneura fumiferana]
MEEVTLPNEIWLKIFKMTDRPKLMELRLVCHRFYDLIEDLLNKKWKKLAKEAISYECLEMTMQRAYPYYLASNWIDIHDPVLWRGTYFSYKKWQKVLVNPYTKDAIVPTSNFGGISCIRTFDKFIAIAFVNGSIASYTIDSIYQPFYVAHHGSNLIQIEFWYSNGDVLLVSVGDDYALKFWDLQNKIEIATNGFFANIISSGECRHFCIGDMGGILTSYERVGNHISPGPTLNLNLRDDEKLIAHAVEGKYMTAMALAKGRTVKFLYEGKIEGGKLIELEFEQKQDWHRLPKNLGASLHRLTMPTVLYFFGISKNCIGSTNYYESQWHEYNLGQHFGCNVKSIALHAQILMFGLEDGSIHLLHISYYGHVMDLEKRIKHSKKIQVDTDPILDLTVLEVDKKPCIVAATEHKVHLVNFF